MTRAVLDIFGNDERPSVCFKTPAECGEFTSKALVRDEVLQIHVYSDHRSPGMMELVAVRVNPQYK